MDQSSVTVRSRVDADLPVLVRLLEAQRAASGYPIRWPLPFPVEEFVARPGELAAWVAQARGVPVGHVSLLDPAPGWEADGWCAGTRLPTERLAAVSVLFLDPELAGRGVGGRLLRVALERARDLGRLPVLDVLAQNTRALALYRRRGFVVVGEARPEWVPAGLGPFLLMALPEEGPALPFGACQR